MEFNSLEELYKRLFPALEMRSKEINKIYSEQEIWDTLSKTKWMKKHDLSLFEMVNDILNFNLIDNQKENTYE